jgi:hypothetical protein
MTAERLYELGSALEAAAHFAPGTAIPVNPLELAHALMSAAAQIKEMQRNG